MIIEWNITKKRGNFRPVLTYTISLEDFEKELGLPQVVLESNIPEPPDSWSASCLPGKCERNGCDCTAYRIYTPDHKTGETSGKLMLPWREGSDYPEVKESFLKLRNNFEAVLKEAYDSHPIDVEGKLELSGDTRRHIASGLVSQRFLKAAGF
ncbi:hypothetical protein [Maridesulfovibrio salexigens]|uniref:Uncharacterized protein n=1 Tax=Maridesulfovibrio salexigens (strain ATCC 14822 / DSM 2638 / NCIMB 8403 / VKM B-1763) TaxID=526222 RepID=C6BY86_MARSD|nr:hypothetical protein [Maridesulfovibrio salexigens]ACS80616.1 hypothetical protein Desal_2560 [Maridesulfovibrio salexigens DSM 2638]